MDPMKDDTEYETYTLEGAEPTDDGQGWHLSFDGSMGIYCPPNATPPEVGATVRLYGKGFGFPVRGIVVGDVVYRYETAAEHDARTRREQAEAKAKRRSDYAEQKRVNDRRIAVLPRPLQERIERFRAANADFGPDLEGYELFCCEQAATFAAVAEREGGNDPERWLREWAAKPYEEQKATMPGMDNGHSGNTFGAAVMLARLYLSRPADVTRLPGSLAPLVGSAAYE